MSLRSGARKASILAATVMLVSALAISGVGPIPDEASPVEDSDAIVCGGVCLAAAAGGAALAGGAAVWLANPEGDVTQEEFDALEASEVAQQQSDMMASMLGAKQQQEAYVAETFNFVEDSRSIASQKAKVRIIEMLNNGTTDPSVIRPEVNETIEDYYAVRQANLVSHYSAHMSQINYSASAYMNDSAFPDYWIQPVDDTSPGPYSNSTIEFTPQKAHDPDGRFTITPGSGPHRTGAMRNVTLANGTTMQAPHLNMYFEHDSEPDSIAYFGLNETHVTDGDKITFPDRITADGVQHPDADINYSKQTVINFSTYHNAWDAVETAMADMKGNYDRSLITDISTGYQAGDVDTSDIVTPEILASELSTKYNQTGDATFKYATIAALGLDSPDLAETAYMNVSYLKQVEQRHIVLNFSGTNVDDSLTVQALGPNTSFQTTVSLPNNPSDYSVRLPVGQDAIVNIKNGSSTSSFDSRTYNSNGYAHSGDSLTIGNTTATVDRVSYRNRETERGMLFMRSAPGDGYEIGKTYDAGNLSSAVYFIPNTENSSLTRVKGNFTINSATDSDGGSLSVVQVQDYNYQTTNASEVIEQIGNLRDVRTDTEAREPDPSPGGGGFSFPSLPGSPQGQMILLLAAFAAIALLRD